MERTCFITGVAGFIGYHTSKLFLENGIKVIGMDALLPYYDIRIKQENIDELSKYDNFIFIKKNILDFDFNSFNHDIDYILHLAASPGVRFSSERTQDYIDNNVSASIKVLEFAKGMNLKKIIMASTSSIYDDSSPLPYSEEAPLNPKAIYGISKWNMENICHVYKRDYDLPVLILRYFSAYGPRQRPDMGIYKFMEKIIKGESLRIYGDGKQSRDFTYVGDVARANLLALESNLKSTILNIASGKRISVNDLIQHIFKISGKEVPIHYIAKLNEESNHTLGDINLAKIEINYQPRISLNEGLLKQWEWVVHKGL